MMQNMHSSQNCNMNSCQHHSMNCNFNGNFGCNSNSGCNSGRNSNSACNNNRNPNCNCNMNQQNLKCYIDFVSFAALDCAMFLSWTVFSLCEQHLKCTDHVFTCVSHVS